MDFGKLGKKNSKNTNQKTFFRAGLLGASVASLVASGAETGGFDPDPNGGEVSGDVSGTTSIGNDILTIGAGGGMVNAGAGDDIVIGGAAADIIIGGTGNDALYGGGGVDNMDGGAGLDHMVVIGITAPNAYSIDDLKNVANSGIDLSGLIDLSLINNHKISDVESGEIIDGGLDGAILYVFGAVDFNGVSLLNISKIYLDGEVLLADASLQTLKTQGLTDLLGDGVIKAQSGLLDLDGVNVPPEITIKDSNGKVILPEFTGVSDITMAENQSAVGAFAVTDASAVGDVSYVLSGVDAAFFNLNATTGEVSFKALPDFENPLDTGNDNVYDVTITATDQHQKSTNQDLKITISDIGGELQVLLHVANEWVKSGDAFTVSNVTDTGQGLPVVTPLQNGNYLILWAGKSGVSSANSSDIRAQVFANNGTEIGDEYILNVELSDTQSNPQVTLLAGGGYVISWETSEDNTNFGGDGSSSGIKAAVFSIDGQVVKSEFVVNDQVEESQRYPHIAALKNGGFIVSWRTYDEDAPGGDGSNHAVKARIFDSDGHAIANEFLVNLIDKNSFQTDPKLVGLNNGGAVVIWSSEANGASEIKMTVLDELGNVVMAENLVNLVAADHAANRAEITQLTNGDFVITWIDTDNNSGEAAIKARIYSDNGVAKGADFAVSGFQFSIQDPTIIGLETGGFSIIWQTGSSPDLIARDFEPDGTALGQQHFLVRTSLYESSQTIAMTDDGGALLTWNSSTGGSGSISSIWAQKYDLAPLYKYSVNQATDFDIIATAPAAQPGGAIAEIVISDIPSGLSFNQGTLVGNVLTLTPAQLTGLTITGSVKGEFSLKISATSVGSGGDSYLATETILLSIGDELTGTDGGDSGLFATAEVQHIDGLAGTDTLRLDGNFADYAFELVGNDIKMTQTASPQNYDLLHSIEKLVFDGAATVYVGGLDDGANFALTGNDYDQWLLYQYHHEIV